MLKPYNELVQIDVKPYCDFREAKDDKGNKFDVPYLNWAVCKSLLHENGAEKVFFEPCVNSNGSSLFMADHVFTDSKGNTNRCYEVRVKITIDDLIFEAQFPLMNGSNPVKDNSLTQQRLWNAQTRAFVKGVAIMTGLGFNLWIDEEHNNAKSLEEEEDLSRHSLAKCKQRLTELITAKINAGIPLNVIADRVGLDEESLRGKLGLYNELAKLEKAIWELQP